MNELVAFYNLGLKPFLAVLASFICAKIVTQLIIIHSDKV